MRSDVGCNSTLFECYYVKDYSALQCNNTKGLILKRQDIQCDQSEDKQTTPGAGSGGRVKGLKQQSHTVIIVHYCNCTIHT